MRNAECGRHKSPNCDQKTPIPLMQSRRISNQVSIILSNIEQTDGVTALKAEVNILFDAGRTVSKLARNARKGQSKSEGCSSYP